MNNGGPAFPIKGPLMNIDFHGLTMRDYFAAKAMQVILQDQYRDGIYVGDADNESEETCATSAYIMADAMLKEREK
jgi:hypothetical protein